VIDVTIHTIKNLTVQAAQVEDTHVPRFTSLRLHAGQTGVRFFFNHTPEDAEAAQRLIDGLHETLSQIMATLEEKEPELVFGDEVAA
jgi:hypothetical protein